MYFKNLWTLKVPEEVIIIKNTVKKFNNIWTN